VIDLGFEHYLRVVLFHQKERKKNQQTKQKNKTKTKKIKIKNRVAMLRCVCAFRVRGAQTTSLSFTYVKLMTFLIISNIDII
jgi:energy-converting hydrogenase Eha subunit H